VTDAVTLFNGGSEALSAGRLGDAVLLLQAAQRLEPRAADIARNAGIAEARVSLSRGEGLGVPDGFQVRAPLSAAEGWWLAVVLLAAGAAGMAWRARRASHEAARGRKPSLSPWLRRLRTGLDAAGAAGMVIAVAMAVSATLDAVAPEAVVMDDRVRLAAASGQPLPGEPALVAGERVRLGREQEGLVEVRLGGTSVGWARREAFWRVRDAAEYTRRSEATRTTDGGKRGK